MKFISLFITFCTLLLSLWTATTQTPPITADITNLTTTNTMITTNNSSTSLSRYTPFFWATYVTTPLVATTTAVPKTPVEIIIVHNGNMKTVFDEIQLPKGKQGTISRLHAYLLHERTFGKKKVFYFNVDTSYSETLYHKKLSFHIITQVMALLHPDAAALGLRAFAGSRDDFTNFTETTKYSLLCCNMNYTKGLKPYKTFDLGNGVSMVVIGYVPEKVNYFHTMVHAIDPVVAIEKVLKTINIPNKLVVVIGCSDFELEKRIAENVEGIDIIIGETVLPKTKHEYPVEYKHKYGKTIVLRTCHAHKSIGIISLTIDPKGKIINASGTISDMLNETKTSQNLTQTLRVFKPVLNRYDTEIIAKSRVNFSPQCKKHECNLGNLIADAFVDYKASKYKGPYWTDTAIALINAGSIKEGVNIEVRNGEITRADILSVLPYQELLVSMSLTGKELYEVLEKGMRNFDGEDEESFLQVSGLRLIFNKTFTDGEMPVYTVQYMRVRCAQCFVPHFQPLEPTARYRIITNEFLAKGGDDYTAMKAGKDVLYEPVTDVDAVMLYVQKFRIVTTEVNSRLATIVFLDGVVCLPNYVMITILCVLCLIININ